MIQIGEVFYELRIDLLSGPVQVVPGHIRFRVARPIKASVDAVVDRAGKRRRRGRMSIHLHVHLRLCRAPELVNRREPEAILAVRRERLPLTEDAVLDRRGAGLEGGPFEGAVTPAFGELESILVEVLVRGGSRDVNRSLNVIAVFRCNQGHLRRRVVDRDLDLRLPHKPCLVLCKERERVHAVRNAVVLPDLPGEELGVRRDGRAAEQINPLRRTVAGAVAQTERVEVLFNDASGDRDAIFLGSEEFPVLRRFELHHGRRAVDGERDCFGRLIFGQVLGPCAQRIGLFGKIVQDPEDVADS